MADLRNPIEMAADKNPPDSRMSANNAGTRFLFAVAAEWRRATGKHAPMNSAHEAYAVILEGVDEFWDEVRRQREDYNASDMYKELTYIAAMAMRAATDLVDDEVWRG